MSSPKPNKPCRHDDSEPGCRACWLYENDPRYRKLWGPKEQPEEPSLLTKASNFIQATLQHFAAGLPVLPDKNVKERLDICQSNECGQYNQGACRKCGCNLNLKATWAEQKCPEGRWPVYIPEEKNQEEESPQ